MKTNPDLFIPAALLALAFAGLIGRLLYLRRRTRRRRSVCTLLGGPVACLRGFPRLARAAELPTLPALTGEDYL